MKSVIERHGNEGISTLDRKIDKSKLMREMEECMDAGMRNQTTIAKRLGCSTPTVNRLMKEHFEHLTNIKEESSQASRLIQLGQIAHIQVLSLNAWKDSLQDFHEVEVTIHHCGVCSGTGTNQDDHSDCLDCKGTGKIESTKTKIRKSTGDSSYLKITLDCIKQIAKLQGTEIDKSGRINIQKMIATAKQVGGEIEQRMEAVYVEAPIDMILKAKQIMADLEEKKIVEVKSDASQDP